MYFFQRLWHDHKRKIKFLIFGALLWFYYTPYGITILADPYSVYRFRTELNNIQRLTPEYFPMVIDHIDRISIAYILGRNAGDAREDQHGNNKVRLLENTFVQGRGYTAATIVHEACHGLQFDQGLPFKPFCENQKREHACNQMGLKVLYAFQAPQNLIDYYEGISVGDGVYGDSCQPGREKAKL